MTISGLPSLRPSLAALLFVAAAVPARAQPNPDGCTTIMTASTALMQRLMQEPGPAFAFEELGEVWSLSPNAAADKQQVCRTIKQKMPPEDQWQYINVFESAHYYVAIAMLHDPNPEDNLIVVGVTTVAVFNKPSLTNVTAFSF